MKISFDLDDTLIPAQRLFATEPMNWLQRLLGVEPIRLGTIKFMEQLKSEGHSICIYTTSFRKEFSIRLAFWTYGVALREVINQSKHDSILKEKRNLYSKYPLHLTSTFMSTTLRGWRSRAVALILKR